MITTIPVLILLCVSTYTDLKENKIKNKNLLLFMLVGFFYQCFSKQTIFPTDALLGFVLPLILIPVFAINMLGAGDIKLFMVLGVWLGWHELVMTMVCSAIVGGLVALILLLIRRNAVQRFKYLFTYIKSCCVVFKVLEYQSFNDENSDGRFPYAIVVLLGYISKYILASHI